MMKKLIAFALILTGGFRASAEIPANYYSEIDGKSGVDIINALQEISTGHTVVTYGDKTWKAFETTDTRSVADRQVWWDMYSNNIVWLPDHASLNVEHSVANSWWGGKSGNKNAYSDLFHLNPSDQNANNRKSNNPPGMVAVADILDNGLSKVGKPVEGQGGGSKNVFEPADEYKGDFARAYFYIFTAYKDASWILDENNAYVYEEGGALRSWARELLIKWHREDPVDSKEIDRNNKIYELQRNRNPFIDYPELAEFIWGSRSGEPVALSALQPAEAIDRPAAPVFGNSRLTGVNTYSMRWWDGFDLPLTGEQGEMMVSIDGDEFYHPAHAIGIDPAMSDTESHIILAYNKSTVNGHELRSSVARLEMTALNPAVKDYTLAKWTLTEQGATLDPNAYYVIISSNSQNVMSTQGGTASTQFMPAAGFVDFDEADCITEMPSAAAMVRFEPTASGKYLLKVYDRLANYLGAWQTTDKNKMLLSDAATPGTASVGAGGVLTFKFDNANKDALQFNKTQPRFLNYASSQTPVNLYKFHSFPEGSGTPVIGATEWVVSVSGNNIEAPAGALIFDINGRVVSGNNLLPGIYIVAGNGKSTKIIMK
ncbi:MAG: endonuclease [Candidatus Amulumruptor caecigallinarius]|nr:endonuclease [Candidatus Amulumruptor caecigallinarius]